MFEIIFLLLFSRIISKKKYTVSESAANIPAFLETLKFAEGTTQAYDPYRVTYGFDHTIQNLSDHPSNTGEWMGKNLPLSYCTGAGLPPGCKSTAAGAYQIIRGTWNNINTENLPFNKQGQDQAAINLIIARNAYNDIRKGRFAKAINKLNREWASLPGSPYGQPTKDIDTLYTYFNSMRNEYLINT